MTDNGPVSATSSKCCGGVPMPTWFRRLRWGSSVGQKKTALEHGFCFPTFAELNEPWFSREVQVVLGSNSKRWIQVSVISAYQSHLFNIHGMSRIAVCLNTFYSPLPSIPMTPCPEICTLASATLASEACLTSQFFSQEHFGIGLSDQAFEPAWTLESTCFFLTLQLRKGSMLGYWLARFQHYLLVLLWLVLQLVPPCHTRNGSGGILVRQRSQYVHVLQLPGCGMSTSPWENKIDTFYDTTALHERRQCSIHDFQNQVPSRSTATCHSKSYIPLSPLLARLSWRFWRSLAIYRN